MKREMLREALIETPETFEITCSTLSRILNLVI